MKLFLSCLLSFSLIIEPAAGFAQTLLPPVGSVLNPTSKFNPVNVKGLNLHPDNPFEFDFIVDAADAASDDSERAVSAEGSLQPDSSFHSESMKLIKYFLASLTVPDSEMWVNLSPAESDRIIAEGLGQTLMGKDLLAQDYLLKQLTASLMNPDTESGKKFWDHVYQTVGAIHELPLQDAIETFNKVWIVPSKAVIYEHGTSAFIVENHLKVMLESDYLMQSRHSEERSDEESQSKILRQKTPQDDGIKDIIRETVIPIIEKEVNEGETFANLRQIYNAMLLATWYKRNLKKSILSQVYIDQNKIQGIESGEADAIEKIYNQYVASFKAGAANLIKEDYDPETQQTVARQYFTGGMQRYLDGFSMEPHANLAQLVAPNTQVVSWSMLNPVSENAAMLVDLKGGYPYDHGIVRFEGDRLEGDQIAFDNQLIKSLKPKGIRFEVFQTGSSTRVTLFLPGGRIRAASLDGFHIKKKVQVNSSEVAYLVSPNFFNELKDRDFPLEFTITKTQPYASIWRASFVVDPERVDELNSAMLLSVKASQNFEKDPLVGLNPADKNFFQYMMDQWAPEYLPPEVVRAIISERDMQGSAMQSALSGVFAPVLENNQRISDIGATQGSMAEAIVPFAVALASGSLSLPVSLDVYNLTSFAVKWAGTKEQIQKYYDPQIKGETTLSFALTEEKAAGSDPFAGMTSIAIYDPTTQTFLLNGDKQYITNDGKYLIFFAVVQPKHSLAGKTEKYKRVAAFFVPVNAQGVTSETMKMRGLPGTGTKLYRVKDVTVSRDALLGHTWLDLDTMQPRSDLNTNEELQLGSTIALTALDIGRMLIGSIALGAQAAILKELTRIYAERFEADSHGDYTEWEQTIRDLRADFNAGWQLLEHVAKLRDKAAADQKVKFGLEVSALKLLTSETAVDNLRRVLLLVGKEALAEDSLLMRLERDTLALPIVEGTTQILRTVVVSDSRRRYAKKASDIDALREASGQRELVDMVVQDILKGMFEKYDMQIDDKREIIQWQIVDMIIEGMALKALRESKVSADLIPAYVDRIYEKLKGFNADFELLTSERKAPVAAKAEEVVLFDEMEVETMAETVKDLAGKSGDKKSLPELLTEEGFFDLNMDEQILNLEMQKQRFIAIIRGCAWYYLVKAREYAEERKAKGGKSIIEFVQVGEMLLKRARLLAESATISQSPEQLADIFMQIARDNVQLHGGYGYSENTAPDQFLKYAEIISLTWLDSMREQKKANSAMVVSQPQHGGIDLDGSKTEIEIQGHGKGFEFDIDPAMLERLQSIDFKGFDPVIINIQPLVNSPLYSELTDETPKQAADDDDAGMDLSYLKKD